MSFKRNKEDFTCEKCGKEVKGTGYTNHCPNCLWSKHVDISPGDRAADCGGMMKPISSESKDDNFVVLLKCEKCGHERKNRLSENDNIEVVLDIAKKKADQFKV